MPVAVIDTFEIINIQHHQSTGSIRIFLRKIGADQLRSAAAVVQAGKGISVRLFFQHPFPFAFHGHIPDNAGHKPVVQQLGLHQLPPGDTVLHHAQLRRFLPAAFQQLRKNIPVLRMDPAADLRGILPVQNLPAAVFLVAEKYHTIFFFVVGIHVNTASAQRPGKRSHFYFICALHSLIPLSG